VGNSRRVSGGVAVVKIDFEFDTQYGKYRDAIYLPEDHAFTNDEINVIKQQRVDNWISFIENPPIPGEQ
jgi:hypothetical protein